MKSLMKRGDTWYLRKHVPEPLRPFFGGKREVWKSLRTKDKREAERRFHAAMAELQREFEDAERRRRADAAEAEHMASERTDTALRKLSTTLSRMELPGTAFAPAAVLPEDADFVRTALKIGQLQERAKTRAEVGRMIDLALEHLEAEREHGVIYAVGEDEDTGEPNWILPARYMDRFEAWLQEQFDADQRSLEALKAQFSGAGEGESQVAESGGATATPPGRLDDLVAVWEQQRKPARSSRHDMKTAVARFQRVNGPLPYREISAEHVRRFKDDLLRDESIKNATKQKLWGMVRSLMAVAKDDALIASDPFDEVKLGRLKDDSETREVLTKDDLRAIFATLKDEEWWLARLALYTGARLGELCQLTKADVIEEGGLSYLNIRPDPESGKTVKTRSSVRRVPVHKQLVADGFLGWVAGRGDGPLFGMSASVASKRLLRRFKALGFGPGKVVHSFRHTFKAAARRVMGEEWHDRLTGHAPKTVGRTYGDYADLKAKIDLVSFGIETEAEHPRQRRAARM